MDFDGLDKPNVIFTYFRHFEPSPIGVHSIRIRVFQFLLSSILLSTHIWYTMSYHSYVKWLYRWLISLIIV